MVMRREPKGRRLNMTGISADDAETPPTVGNVAWSSIGVARGEPLEVVGDGRRGPLHIARGTGRIALCGVLPDEPDWNHRREWIPPKGLAPIGICPTCWDLLRPCR